MKLVLGGMAGLVLLTGIYLKHTWLLSTVDQTINGPRTVSQRVHEYGDIVAARLRPILRGPASIIRRAKSRW